CQDEQQRRQKGQDYQATIFKGENHYLKSVIHNRGKSQIQHPKVSVILPIYNASKELERCLNIIISQSLKDIEIICINDGSTDNSLEILKHYQSIDDRIVIFSQDNAGSGAARNLGIQEARGEFAAFMDSDDFYPDITVLEKLYKAAKENNVKICGGSMSEYYPQFKEVNSEYFNEFEGFHFHQNALIDYCDYQYDYGYYRFIYDLKFLRDNNIIFPKYQRFQDPVFMVKAFLAAKQFYAVTDATYCYIHTPKIFLREQITDIVKASSEIFEIARTNKLEQLCRYAYYHIGYFFRDNTLPEDKEYFIKTFKETNADFDYSLIPDDRRWDK
ncbi:MAG: glycosyltransferase, partial [Endomicrobium sp.]|nr:glycosyltransferase [Endomicrobium sp.]